MYSAFIAFLRVRNINRKYNLGLFEKHKLLFSFQMTIKLEQDQDRITQEELDFFYKGNIALEKSRYLSNIYIVIGRRWKKM